jgi:hypothetical protein
MGPMKRSWPMVAPVLAAALLAAIALGACSAAPSATSTPTGSVAPSTQATGGIGFQLLDGMPAERDEASVEAAFDQASAAKLMQELPTVDFAKQGVLCLYLGQRTGKWGFGVNGLTLEDGTLHIAASERPPRAGDTSTTHPAQCLAIERTTLPAGELPVTAVDTVSDEFFVDGKIEVPSGSSGP